MMVGDSSVSSSAALTARGSFVGSVVGMPTLTTKDIPANETDTLSDQLGELVESRFSGLDHMRVVLQDVQRNTNIEMERNMSRDHEQTRRLFIRMQSTKGRAAMMRASGRSILRICDVWEHDFQNS